MGRGSLVALVRTCLGGVCCSESLDNASARSSSIDRGLQEALLWHGVIRGIGLVPHDGAKGLHGRGPKHLPVAPHVDQALELLLYRLVRVLHHVLQGLGQVLEELLDIEAPASRLF